MVARLRIQQSAQLVARHPPWLELLRDAALVPLDPRLSGHSPIGAANHAVLGPLSLRLNVLLKVKARHALRRSATNLRPRWRLNWFGR
jgi:hypothetical protein